MTEATVESQTELLPQEPLSPERTRAILDDFQRNGAAILGRMLSAEEVAALKARVDSFFVDPKMKADENIYGDYIGVRLFEWDAMFRDLMVREPLIGLMETLLGADCHLIANNIVRNKPGQAIDQFHVDDLLWFPLPADLPRFDQRMSFPTLLVNVQIALTDIDAEEFGPTQFVPGSHYSGRNPNDVYHPEFESRREQSLLVPAGTVYLQHPQVWHRGAPNTSTRTRYLLQYGYGKRFIAQRFFPFLNYRMPDHVLQGADARLQRVLGKHSKGAYG